MQQPAESIWTTVVTVLEISFGLEILADGRHRRQLGEAFGRMLEEDLEGRVLPFCRSSETRRARRRASPHGSVGPAVRSRAATRRSPASSPPGEGPRRPAARGIL
jgi:hypothetical protein